MCSRRSSPGSGIDPGPWGLASLVLLGGIVLVVPLLPVGSAIGHAVHLLAAGDVQAVRAYVLAAGVWAPLVSVALMLLQAVIAPLPSSAVTYANGLIFGAWWGGLLSWASALLAAALCFGLSRWFGRPVAERFVSRRALEWSDAFFARFGARAVLVGRLLPFVSFDVVSYGAGLTRLSLARFVTATAAGMIPATFVYSYLGHLGSTSTRAFVWTLVTTTGVGLVLLALGPTITKHLVGTRNSPGSRDAAAKSDPR